MRPDADNAWVADGEKEQFIEITLSDNPNKLIYVHELEFPELDNVWKINILLANTRDGPFRSVNSYEVIITI